MTRTAQLRKRIAQLEAENRRLKIQLAAMLVLLKRRPVDDSVRQRFNELRRQGKSYGQIAKAEGYPRDTVIYHVKVRPRRKTVVRSTRQACASAAT
jgi:hypothetical protein